MLDTLNQQPPDALLALIKFYEADERDGKIDLGVGVYRTAEGDTPVFKAIKEAEARLQAEQPTKAYLGPEGDMGFVHALMPYIFGPHPARAGRIEGMQTPGGTGAVRLAAALAALAGADRIVMGTPSWPNHAQIFSDLGIETIGFAHATPDGNADLDALFDALRGASRETAVLLQGCCHNPTGIDYTRDQWDKIAAFLAETGVLPIIDLAYQGLGDGLDEDAYGMRTVLAAVPEALVAYSCDKNFGLYRDRVGALYIMAREAGQTSAIMSNGYALARANWSMPPDHGAAAVRIVLRDDQLARDWLEELSSMRTRMNWVRETLATVGIAGTIDLTPLRHQRGMFAMLPLDKAQIRRLRDEYGVYMAGSGRINIAGLHQGNIDSFIAALADVSG